MMIVVIVFSVVLAATIAAVVLLVAAVRRLGLDSDDHENRIGALEQGAIRSRRQ